jgi:hypothetical protein
MRERMTLNALPVPAFLSLMGFFLFFFTLSIQNVQFVTSMCCGFCFALPAWGSNRSKSKTAGE